MLKHEGLFLSKDSIPDHVALLAIYMPQIRQRVQSWTSTYNIRPIRAQKNPLITGKPIFNYFHSASREPPVEDQKRPINPGSPLIQQLQRDMQEYNLDEYLPPLTLAWCRVKLQEIGQVLGLPVGTDFDPENPPLDLRGDPKQPYRVVYEYLRARAYDHLISGEEPILGVCEKPYGAANWSPARADPSSG
jgi:hypothetical protein